MADFASLCRFAHGWIVLTQNDQSVTKFDIRLSSGIPKELDESVSAVYGNIQIGAFKETLVTSLIEWTPVQYRRQWLDAGRRLLDSAPKSAFVTPIRSTFKAQSSRVNSLVLLHATCPRPMNSAGDPISSARRSNRDRVSALRDAVNHTRESSAHW